MTPGAAIVIQPRYRRQPMPITPSCRALGGCWALCGIHLLFFRTGRTSTPDTARPRPGRRFSLMARAPPSPSPAGPGVVRTGQYAALYLVRPAHGLRLPKPMREKGSASGRCGTAANAACWASVFSYGRPQAGRQPMIYAYDMAWCAPMRRRSSPAIRPFRACIGRQNCLCEARFRPVLLAAGPFKC